jgi:serine/threonine protein phosphatase PrpC
MGKLHCDVAAASDVGVVRLNNEDAFFCGPDAGLFLICDGMGGEQAGEVASRIAVQTIPSVVGDRADFYYDEVDDFFSPAEQHTIHSAQSKLGHTTSFSRASELLVSAIKAANREIYLASHAVETQRGMGTTVAAILISCASATIAHVGDSRVYLMRDNSLELLTLDHSVAAEQMRAGMTRDMVLHSPYQNCLTRALGPAAEVTPDLREIEVRDDDLFLLATDGLTGTVADEEILHILTTQTSLHNACLCLIDAAKHRGSRDNITCTLVRVQGALEF